MEIDTSAPEQQFVDSDDEREFKETQKNQSTTEFNYTVPNLTPGLLVAL